MPSSGGGVRARVPEKQGLKPPSILDSVSCLLVRARVPEKQGLKHEAAEKNDRLEAGPGASSRKTRIETFPIMRTIVYLLGPGASSRKTRIETNSETKRLELCSCPGASSRKTRIETLFGGKDEGSQDLSGREFQKNKD